MNSGSFPSSERSPAQSRNMTVTGGDQLGLATAVCSVPGDKSISQRILILSITMRCPLMIRNLNRGSAVSVLLPVLESLGLRVLPMPDSISVQMPKGFRIREPQSRLNLKGSSAAARFLLGLLAGLGVRAEIDGDEVLRRQPMNWVVDPLRTLGARVSYLETEGHLPVLLERGSVRDGEVTLTVGSAQASTAVMFAAFAARTQVRIFLKARSRDHTERLLRTFGTTVAETHDGLEIVGRPPNDCAEYIVPGDPSAAAYVAAAQVMGNRERDLLIRNVCLNPTRLGFFRLLIDCGVPIMHKRESIRFGEPVGDLFIGRGPYKLRPFSVRNVDDFHSMIDEVPLAAALATRIPGKSTIDHAGELRFKETDRLLTTTRMLSGFGAVAGVSTDSITIEGGNVLGSARVPSFNDHRIAMAAAALASSIPGDSQIIGGACAEASFPNFDRVMREAGFQVDFS